MTPDTDPSLLFRLRNPADAQAWEMFVSIYGPLIARYCRRRGLQEADSVDVSQNTLAKVMVGIRRFEHQAVPGGFRAWLGTVVRSCLNDHFARSRQVSGAGGASEPQETAGTLDAEWTSQFHDHILRTAMDRCRGDFEPANWRAFERTWIDNQPAAEVARELNLAVADVYVAKSRVLRRLRKEVSILAEDLPHLFVGVE